MDRRKFLGRFGLGLGAAVLAPTVVREISETEHPPAGRIAERHSVTLVTNNEGEFIWKEEGKISGIIDQIHERGNVFTYYTEASNRRGTEEFKKTWKWLLEEY